jgi:hypothetical protein
MEMKISQPIFGILVVLTKNEFTKICNEPGIHLIILSKCALGQRAKVYSQK